MCPKKKISIIVPAYNSQDCISRAIESLLSQSYSITEILVVDDGSSDNTANVVQSFGDPVRYIHQENSGVSKARNTGIAHATGEWIGFLDADDEFLPEHIEQQIEILDRSEALKWCAGNYILDDGERARNRTPVERIESNTHRDGYFSDYFLNAAKKNCYISTCTVLIHKEVLSDVGGFEVGRTVAEDVDLWWRIAHKYPSIGYVAHPITRVHLDCGVETFGARRMQTKSGKDIREIVARHLELSHEAGDYASFSLNAAAVMKDRLLEMLYNGFHKEARETVTQFNTLFPLHWRAGCLALTIFPSVSTKAMHMGVRVLRKVGVYKAVTR